MPKPFRAFEPRIDIPTSRGPLPCLIEIPGLWRRISPIENAGWSWNCVPGIVVTVCPVGWVSMSKGGIGGAGEAVTTTAGKPITPPFEGGKEGGICASWAAARVEAKHTNTTSATYPLAADCGMSKRSFPLTSVKKQPTGAEKISAPDSGEV